MKILAEMQGRKKMLGLETELCDFHSYAVKPTGYLDVISLTVIKADIPVEKQAASAAPSIAASLTSSDRTVGLLERE